jgi:hypothetical protein
MIAQLLIIEKSEFLISNSDRSTKSSVIQSNVSFSVVPVYPVIRSVCQVHFLTVQRFVVLSYLTMLVRIKIVISKYSDNVTKTGICRA